jgi:hypothetical protein
MTTSGTGRITWPRGDHTLLGLLVGRHGLDGYAARAVMIEVAVIDRRSPWYGAVYTLQKEMGEMALARHLAAQKQRN